MLDDSLILPVSHTSLPYITPKTSRHPIVPPPPVAAKDAHIVTNDPQGLRRPTEIELDQIRWGQRLDGPDDSRTPSPSELEEDNAPSSASRVRSHEVTAITLPTISNPPMNKWRIPVLCLAFFIQGLNDSAPGALLPYMKSHYDLEYTVESLIFIANAVGFILAAPVCNSLNNRFGRAKVLSACALLNTLAYLAIACQPPWAVVIVAFLVLGKWLDQSILHHD